MSTLTNRLPKEIFHSTENVAKFIEDLLEHAVQLHVSDIHLEPRAHSICIRYRIDGELVVCAQLDKKLHSPLVTRIKILAKMDIAERRLPQDGRVEMLLANKKIDLRISTIPITDGEKVVLRILDPDAFRISKYDLGYLERDIALLEQLIRIPNGLIVLTGPTGCGKTTTLYTLIQDLNQENINIVTIEDPVEYKMEGINQIQVNEKAGLNFGNALRSVLRQDPDFILVGEIRDRLTAEITVRSAITGHLVISTLHTNDSYSAIHRLLDIGIEDYLLASALRGVLSQRLIRKLCPHCRQPVALKPSIERMFQREGIEIPNQVVYQPVGCDHCYNGYFGRQAVLEIITIDEDMLPFISKEKDLGHLRRYGNEKGFSNLFQKGLGLVAEGITSLEEIMKISIHGYEL